MRSLLLVAVAAALGASAVYYFNGAPRRREQRRDSWTDAEIAHAVKVRLASLVSFPEAIEVTTGDGTVRLAGPVLRKEMQQLLLGVRDVAGVRMVYNALSPHETVANMPALRGRPARGAASA